MSILDVGPTRDTIATTHDRRESEDFVRQFRTNIHSAHDIIMTVTAATCSHHKEAHNKDLGPTRVTSGETL